VVPILPPKKILGGLQARVKFLLDEAYKKELTFSYGQSMSLNSRSPEDD
jgi:hypothetical protein